MPGFRIALFMHDRLNDYQSQLLADFEHAARRHDLQVVTHSAEKNAETQQRQIRAALVEAEAIRPKAFVISPVSEVALLPLIHDAARRGIAWAFLTRWNDALHGLRLQYPQIPIFAVMPDHLEIGRIQGQQLRLMLGSGDEVVYIQGPMTTYSSRRRREGIEKELSDKRDLVWSSFNADWSQAGGQDAMRSWLSTFTLKRLPSFVVAAQNDAMGVGARAAFLEWSCRNGVKATKDLCVLGCDGSPGFGQRMVISGELRATVVVPPVSGRAVDEIVAAGRTGRPPLAEITVGVHSHPDIDTLSRGVTRRENARKK